MTPITIRMRSNFPSTHTAEGIYTIICVITHCREKCTWLHCTYTYTKYMCTIIRYTRCYMYVLPWRILGTLPFHDRSFWHSLVSPLVLIMQKSEVVKYVAISPTDVLLRTQRSLEQFPLPGRNRSLTLQSTEEENIHITNRELPHSVYIHVHILWTLELWGIYNMYKCKN